MTKTFETWINETYPNLYARADLNNEANFAVSVAREAFAAGSPKPVITFDLGEIVASVHGTGISYVVTKIHTFANGRIAYDVDVLDTEQSYGARDADLFVLAVDYYRDLHAKNCKIIDDTENEIAKIEAILRRHGIEL